MKFSVILAIAASAAMVSASPLIKRQGYVVPTLEDARTMFAAIALSLLHSDAAVISAVYSSSSWECVSLVAM